MQVVDAGEVRGDKLSKLITSSSQLVPYYLKQLKNANLREASLIEADLSDSKLIRANLSYADPKGANLAGANLKGVIIGESEEEVVKFLQELDEDARELILKQNPILRIIWSEYNKDNPDEP